MLIGSAVFPIAFCMMWSKCNKYGAIAGAFIGQWTGITVWLCYAKIGYKTINLTTTGYNYPMLAGEPLKSVCIGIGTCPARLLSKGSDGRAMHYVEHLLMASCAAW